MEALPARTAPALHPLLQRLVALLDAPLIDADSLEAWAARPGNALLFFSEDPVQFRETLDLAVIVPELAAAFPGRFRVGLVPAHAARALASRYGFRRWPALVLLRDGRYVGAIEGLLDWSDYTERLAQLLDADPSRPPGVGIAVRAADDGLSSCH